ncbi:uncharacterized protein (DUF1800 family) [Methylorubrum rhodinum]|uniref:Uncharacterized protein (DUF1800 family) n=1 Tax=Methylorubrum rhodinum TaxID=29428 RepID=A0A840ZIL9_9HYPH|nr:DUF1800 domain-containing protein [Methylorubrum rhodinum]MBB5756841.1 uncharacterized protein (DUF1800 family) [Methylorubrum rhodinum]
MPIPMRRLTGLLALALLCASAPARAEVAASRPPAPARVAPSVDDAALLDALSFGITADDLARMRAMGREAWLDAQLHPAPGLRLPPEAQAASAPFRDETSVLDAFSAYSSQVKAVVPMPDGEERRRFAKEVGSTAIRAGERAVARTILAALASPDQLRERMTWFWLNRFSVYQMKSHLRLVVGDYVDAAIRPHALGRFRDLLGAVLCHPAMLDYLDNAKNTAERRNENYARELMELHTLGVNGGYTQGDVEQLARILTGVGYGLAPEPRMPPDRQRDYRRDGLFVFDPTRHDYGDKRFLGRTIKGGGFAEVEEALDLLARHPATARHVSAALARAILGADPSEAMVGRLAGVFTDSDGDIARVVGALVRDPDFAAGVGRGFKDPVRYVLSAVRLAYGDRAIRNPTAIQSWLKRLGEGLFFRTTPDGYPSDAAAWNGPGQMVARFEVASLIGGGAPTLFASPVEGTPPPEGPKPPPPTLRNEVYATVLHGRLGAPTLAALAQAKPGPEWNMLLLASPEFMHGLAPQESLR